MTTEQIIKEIADLSKDVAVAHNSGTFSAAECCRATGSGETKSGEWTTCERLDGSRYTIGADPKTAPGYARYSTPMSAAARREEIATLKLALAKSKTAAQEDESKRANLARGWDGYQFIGIEEGERRLAAQQ
jgi:hypothetical protein